MGFDTIDRVSSAVVLGLDVAALYCYLVLG